MSNMKLFYSENDEHNEKGQYLFPSWNEGNKN